MVCANIVFYEFITVRGKRIGSMRFQFEPMELLDKKLCFHMSVLFEKNGVESIGTICKCK